MEGLFRLMFLRRVVSILTVFYVLLLLSSCNEEPTFMGSTLLQDTVAIFPLSTTNDSLITAASSFLHRIDMLNTGVMHIGEAHGISAISMIRFTEPIKLSSDYDFLVNYPIDKIQSCKIKLFPNRYTFGDSVNPNALSFKVYKVQSYWSNLTNWDSLYANNFIDYSTPVATFNGSITQKDSMDYIEIDLDKQVFLDWTKSWFDYKNGDSSSIVWGLAFVPDENSSVIRQFSVTESATSESTRLSVVFVDTAGVVDSLMLSTALDKPFYKIPEFDPTEMFFQGALTFRTKLHFDVSMIPAKSAIHSAQFELTLNRAKSLKGNYPLDSTLLAALPRDTSEFNTDNFLRLYYAEATGDKFIFNSITSAVETWNRGSGTGLLVFHPDGSQNEIWEFDKLSFYGPNDPDSTKRPVLKIIYSRIIR